MEGFALYGAALHPTAAAPVQAMLEATRDCRSPSAGREPAEKSGNDGADNNGNDNNGNIVRLSRRATRCATGAELKSAGVARRDPRDSDGPACALASGT